MKRYCILCLALTLPLASALADNWQALIASKGSAVGKVEIRSEKEPIAYGSCFVIDAEGTIITNAHVIEPLKQNPGAHIFITFPYGLTESREWEATVLDVAEDLDIAVLSSKARPASFCPLDTAGVPPLMSEVLVVGYPLGKSFKSTPGYIQAMQDVDGIGPMIDLSASIAPGNSGGPVFNKEGKVIGIVTAQIWGANFNLALPSAHALSLLSKRTSLRPVALTSTPEGARVFINGIYRGILPLSLDLYDREYEFVLEKEGFETLRTTRALALKEEARIAFTLKPTESLMAELLITSDPAGASISINNTEVGTTPFTFTSEKGSKLRIKLSKKGYKESYRELVLDASGADLSVPLTKAGLFH